MSTKTTYIINPDLFSGSADLFRTSFGGFFITEDEQASFINTTLEIPAEDVFDAVVKNPKVITDHGCDPLGVRISPTSSQAMECSFLWNGLRIYCIKNLDLDACNGVNHDG